MSQPIVRFSFSNLSDLPPELVTSVRAVPRVPHPLRRRLPPLRVRRAHEHAPAPVVHAKLHGPTALESVAGQVVVGSRERVPASRVAHLIIPRWALNAQSTLCRSWSLRGSCLIAPPNLEWSNRGGSQRWPMTITLSEGPP